LTPEQRAQLVRVPHDLSERQIARYFTLSEADIDLINQRRQPWTRLGFGLQLALLRFPGRALTDMPEVPQRVVAFVAEQLGVEPAAFIRYGERPSTVYEHLDELRRIYGFRMCGRAELRMRAPWSGRWRGGRERAEQVRA
jgi:TnpA family transposase